MTSEINFSFNYSLDLHDMFSGERTMEIFNSIQKDLISYGAYMLNPETGEVISSDDLARAKGVLSGILSCGKWELHGR